MIIKNKTYRHRASLDIDVHVLGQVAVYPAYIEFYGSYWNRHYKIFQGEPEIIRIRKQELSNWVQV